MLVNSDILFVETHVWTELEVSLSSLDILLFWVIQVTVDDLLGECERTVETV